MKTTAAVLVELGKPLELTELEIPALKPGQVLVEIKFSGVCHTQILEARGYRGNDPYIPHCLGHEGSGVVVEAGPGCTKVKPGDHVVLSWMKGSGGNVPGTVYGWNGKTVNAGGITTFGRHSVISENRLTPLPAGVSMRDAALIGCAVATGVGSVFNTAVARPGESLAVFGSGGIGLCAIAGAQISGCYPIVAVDVLKSKLDLAKQMGATHVIDASSEDVLEAMKAACPSGLDKAIESSGRPDVMRTAFEAVRPQGGVAVVVGNARHGEEFSVNPLQFNLGKQLRGTWGGDNDPDRDFPRYGMLMASGRLDVSRLISEIYSLDRINEALDDLEQGNAARPLIDMEAGE